MVSGSFGLNCIYVGFLLLLHTEQSAGKEKKEQKKMLKNHLDFCKSAKLDSNILDGEKRTIKGGTRSTAGWYRADSSPARSRC